MVSDRPYQDPRLPPDEPGREYDTDTKLSVTLFGDKARILHVLDQLVGAGVLTGWEENPILNTPEPDLDLPFLAALAEANVTCVDCGRVYPRNEGYTIEPPNGAPHITMCPDDWNRMLNLSLQAQTMLADAKEREGQNARVQAG